VAGAVIFTTEDTEGTEEINDEVLMTNVEWLAVGFAFTMFSVNSVSYVVRYLW